jgi:hypothetical protein
MSENMEESQRNDEFAKRAISALKPGPNKVASASEIRVAISCVDSIMTSGGYSEEKRKRALMQLEQALKERDLKIQIDCISEAIWLVVVVVVVFMAVVCGGWCRSWRRAKGRKFYDCPQELSATIFKILERSRERLPNKLDFQPQTRNVIQSRTSEMCRFLR